MPVAANPITEILDREYLDFAHALNYSGVYAPDKNIQHDRHITGWIDIVGYDNLTCKDGVYCVPRLPETHAIVKYKLWDTGLTWNNNLDYIKVTDERVYQEDMNITTEIDIHLLWHRSTLKTSPNGGKYISKTYHHEYATFSDTEIAPLQFQSVDFSNVSVEVVIYNNTVSPKTTFRVLNITDNTLSINYTYDNEIIIHYMASATQEYTDKNSPYMQIHSTDIWKDDGNLSQFNGFVIMPSMNFSEDNLTITLNTPYETHIVENVTVYELKWHGAKDTFSPFLVPFFGIIGVIMFGIWVQLRRLR